MEAKRSNAKYASNLMPEARKRYYEKLCYVDGVDPYELPTNSWTSNPDFYPPVDYANIVNYFVLGVSAYTCDDFKAYKSLQAYKLFVSGWVREIQIYRPDGSPNVIVSAKVLHSQRLNEKCLQPWLIAGDDGGILTAHCTCMAGVGETCTHVAALAFALDSFTRARETTTVTGVPAYWKIPTGVKGVVPRPACDIDFSSAKQRKKNIESFILDPAADSATKNKLKPLPHIETSTEDEVNLFFEHLKLGPTPYNILKLTSHCNSSSAFEYSSIPADKTMTFQPANLITLRQEKMVGKPLVELQEYCRTLSVQMLSSEINKIEMTTRDQALNETWFSARAGRITASNLHAVCHTDVNSPAPSLIKKICYPESVAFCSEQTDWGKNKEKLAKVKYCTMLQNEHTNFCMRDSGLYISPEYPFLGASPDAIVECECHGTGCVEVKCPFKHREHTIDIAVQDAKFCLRHCQDKVLLKEDHPYYYQVQAHLYSSKLSYCDFVVWTTVDICVQRIFPNQVFWDDCVTKATALFKLAILPELVGNWLDHKPADSTCVQESMQCAHADSGALFCVCHQPEQGRMVACDNSDCPIEWFHYSCVGIQRKPKGQWLCPLCAPLGLSINDSIGPKKLKS